MKTQLPFPTVAVAGSAAIETAPPALEGVDVRSTAEQARVAARARDAGISPGEYDFNVLVLNYTMQCPLACDFCCYSCGPHRTETMGQHLAAALIDQAADLGVFGAVAFTGGEPFIFYDELVELSAILARRGLPLHVITACRWATEDANPAEILRPLVANGLTRLAVSHDPSHQRWVTRDQVRSVITAALGLGLEVSVYGTFYDSQSTLEQIFPEYAEAGPVQLSSRLAAPQVGRRQHANPLPVQRPHPHLATADTCYSRVFHEITVFWDGEVYPCCSVYNRETPGISYGNVHDVSLGEIWNRIEGSLFLRMIKRRGFLEMFSLLRERAPEVWESLPSPLAATSACHLCHLVMGDPVLSTRIREAIDGWAPEPPQAGRTNSLRGR